jgi:hypothetical protein
MVAVSTGGEPVLATRSQKVAFPGGTPANPPGAVADDQQQRRGLGTSIARVGPTNSFVTLYEGATEQHASSRIGSRDGPLATETDADQFVVAAVPTSTTTSAAGAETDHLLDEPAGRLRTVTQSGQRSSQMIHAQIPALAGLGQAASRGSADAAAGSPDQHVYGDVSDGGGLASRMAGLLTVANRDSAPVTGTEPRNDPSADGA